MAPGLIEVKSTSAMTDVPFSKAQKASQAISYTPMKSTGFLDKYECFKNTPWTGTEFRNVNLKEWMTGPDSEQHMRELAIMIAERGVVFFRAQADFTNEDQKEFNRRISDATNKPKESGLYKHVMHQIRKDDPECSKLDPATQRKMHLKDVDVVKQSSANEWHSDMSLEVVAPDFTVMRLTEVPPTGGDTLWANCYELYERLSPPYQKFFEAMTATHGSPALANAAATQENIFKGARGHPDNTSLEMHASHPMVRTNPITGWKSLYAGGMHCRRIDGVTQKESDEILEKIINLVCYNHELVVRFHWENAGDIAVWDNRCTLHAATQDCYGEGPRSGYRTISMAEKPFLDPNSTTRRAALGLGKWV